MKILVIDDKQMHRDSALTTLIGHEVTVIDSYEQALVLLKGPHASCPFDVVLTDMNMPMSGSGLISEHYQAGAETPYGFVITLLAARCGAKYVGMLTDQNHHHGPMSQAVDHLQSLGFCGYQFQINCAKVMYAHSEYHGAYAVEETGAKNWGRFLQSLIQ